MTSQEILTAMRINIPIVILIWSDSEYGLISWKQKAHYGHESFTHIRNPNFVK